MDIDDPVPTCMPSPPRRPAVTLTFNISPPESNQVTNSGYRILPVNFIKIVHVVHEISWEQQAYPPDELTRWTDSRKSRLCRYCRVTKTWERF